MCRSLFFFFNDTATTEIYTLSLHDALPISGNRGQLGGEHRRPVACTNQQVARVTQLPQAQLYGGDDARRGNLDRKSTRLNSSHSQISYAVFCLKKKKRHQPALRKPDAPYHR